MIEQRTENFSEFIVPTPREFSPEDVDRSIGKLGHGVTRIAVESPILSEEVTVAVHRDSEIDQIGRQN